MSSSYQDEGYEDGIQSPEDLVAARNFKEAQRLRSKANDISRQIREHEEAISRLGEQRDKLAATARVFEGTAQNVASYVLRAGAVGEDDPIDVV